jgi:hypothetical protein
MNRAVPLPLCAILLILLTAGQCDEESPCPGQDCFSRLTLYLRPSSPATFSTGTYRIEALFDGESATCNFTVASERTSHYDCGEREILAAVDLIFMTFPGTPADVDLTLRKGDEVLFQEAFSPTYEVTFPGGPECGVSCEAADEEFFITP